MNAAIDEQTIIINGYKFWEDLHIKTKTVKMYPNNKPWVTKELKISYKGEERCF